MSIPDDTGPAPDSLFGGSLEKFLERLVAVVLFAMMAMVFADVFARYLFSAPIPGGFELTEVMMGALVFCGLPLATAREEHVTIGLLDGLFRGPARRVRQTVLNLIGAGGAATLGWHLWLEAGKLAEWGDYTAYLNIPIAPIVYLFAMMAGLSAAAFLMLAFQHATGRRHHAEHHGGEL